MFTCFLFTVVNVRSVIVYKTGLQIHVTPPLSFRPEKPIGFVVEKSFFDLCGCKTIVFNFIRLLIFVIKIIAIGWGCLTLR